MLTALRCGRAAAAAAAGSQSAVAAGSAALPGRCAFRCLSSGAADPLAVLTPAQRTRTVVPAFWRARAVRLEEEDKARCLCRDSQAGLLADALLSAAEREALEARPDAEDEMLVAGVRAAFMDRFVLDAIGRRVRQVVLLGSGMDSRAYRMDVPPQLAFTEVEAASVLEAKTQVLMAAGQRARCAVRQAPLDIAAGDGAADGLAAAIAPAVASARRAGLLFLLDGAFEAWPGAAQKAAFEALVAVAPNSSTIVGPVPSEEAVEVLTAGGFSKINKVNHHQLSKIFGVPLPEGTAMLVAMRGVEGPARPAAEPLPSEGGGRGREVQF